MEHEVRLIVRRLPLRGTVAVAARCASIALARLRQSAVRKDRALLQAGVATCVRVAERDEHGEEGELHGVGGRAVDLAQTRSLPADDARLLECVAGACYAAATYSEWLAGSPQRRALLGERVVDNALRACRGVLGHDATVDAETLSLCHRVETAARSEQWKDETPVVLADLG